mmetsp:Transcript_9201/g.30343  ORF Transcript_9201/g.30343 Transcript_9201/m.30343 type:complete len:223 (+) Transcript_9201:1944-2612(+)
MRAPSSPSSRRPSPRAHASPLSPFRPTERRSRSPPPTPPSTSSPSRTASAATLAAAATDPRSRASTGRTTGALFRRFARAKNCFTGTHEPVKNSQAINATRCGTTARACSVSRRKAFGAKGTRRPRSTSSTAPQTANLSPPATTTDSCDSSRGRASWSGRPRGRTARTRATFRGCALPRTTASPPPSAPRTAPSSSGEHTTSMRRRSPKRRKSWRHGTAAKM